MCAHCSLRRDLPGFISKAHAQGNINQIKDGEIFACHMIADPHDATASNRKCLGAALVAGVALANRTINPLPPVYESLDDYLGTQVAGRVSEAWLRAQQRWRDVQGRSWYGWWAQAPAENWHYLVTTLDANRCDSGYLFFEQFEKLFGPVKRVL
jgi:hypothetical protein